MREMSNLTSVISRWTRRLFDFRPPKFANTNDPIKPCTNQRQAIKNQIELLKVQHQGGLRTKESTLKLRAKPRYVEQTRLCESVMELSTMVFKNMPQNSIRLLTIEPGAIGDTNDQIICSLQRFNLGDAPPYECLSYVWGSDLSDERHILCNGKTFRVRENLCRALIALRYPDRRRIIWVDQICINQNDLDERSAQVMVMDKIFRRAACVIFYPGELDVTMVKALHLIVSVCEKIGQKFLHNENGIQARLNELSVEEITTSFAIPPPEHDEWHALRSFLARPCFRRIWLLQEVALASKLKIAFGRYELDWNYGEAVSFTTFIGIMERWARNKTFGKRLYVDTEIVGASTMTGMRGLSQLLPDDPVLGLLPLLVTTRQFAATDPRDKIYGALSVSTDGYDICPRPDYSLSLREVYTLAARGIIEQMKNLDILTFVEIPKHDGLLPTWAPDWRAETMQHYQHGGVIGRRRYGCTGQSQCYLRDTMDVDKLIIRGLLVAEINSIAIGPTQSHQNYDTVDMFGYGLWWMRACLAAENMRYKHTGEHVQRALARTRVADLGLNDHRLMEGNLYQPESGFWRVREDEVSSLDWPEIGMLIFKQTFNRSLFTSESGYIGLVPITAQLGDLIYLLPGGEVPFVLRPTAVAGEFTLIGDCYVHGIMDGEAYSPDMETEEIVLR